MNKALLHKDVQQFLREYYKQDIAKVVFQGSPFEKVSVRELAEQLVGMKKAEKKLPTWFRTNDIIYPPSLNLEQTSSETTAKYKASLISGNTIADLTGGFGVDSYFFARKFGKVIHCEINPDLSELVAHNKRQLETENLTTLATDGMEFLEGLSDRLDWIYVDPSRRDDSGGKVFRLGDCLPNVPEHLDLLLSRAGGVMLKTSPLIDLQAGISDLKYVQEVHIVAVENEVKELLWILKGSISTPKVKAVNFKGNEKEVYENSFTNTSTADLGEPLRYLYEPNAAIMKSGLFNSVGENFTLKKLHPNSHLFTSDGFKEFPGRRFEILRILPYNKKLKKTLALQKANITTRNFPETVAGLRKSLKLKDGGETYLFFTTTENDKKVCLVCRKV